jgi:UDP-glucose 4-epimerase
MASRRVLITGISSFLGSALAQALEPSAEISYLAGVDVKEPSVDLKRTEFIKADIRNPLIRRALVSSEIDTVVHTAIVSTPSGVGGRIAQKERNVIGTMQLLAACQRSERVKKLIVRSSTAVYGIEPGAPSLLTEDWSSRLQPERGYSSDIVEAETYARDFGRRRPDVDVTILRMTNIVGPRADTNMTQFFSLPAIPTALGFDPRLQLLHEDDALETLRRAVLEEHPGVFNVAADGVIYLSQAIRLARRIPVPILLPVAQAVADMLRSTGLVDFSADQVNLVLHGRVVDNTRLKEAFGYEPQFSTLEAFQDFASARRQSVRGPRVFADWEAGLYSFIEERLRKIETR